MCSRFWVLPARENHGHPEITAELMHVGCDREGFDVDGDVPACLDLDVGLARRQPEDVVGGVGPVKRLADRLLAEVDAQPRAVDLGLAAGMVMDLEEDVGAGRQGAADPVGQMVGHIPGRPAAQVSFDLDAGSRVRRVAGSRVGGVALLVPRPWCRGRP